MLQTQVFHRNKLPSNVFAGVVDPAFSYGSAIIAAGNGAARELPLGAVLGRRLFAAPVAAAAPGNTGNGVIGAVALGRAAKLGVYRLTCVTAAANAGVFAVVDPDGGRLGDLTVGLAYANQHLSVTISDGATDFVVGDVVTITVTAGSGHYVAVDFAATDGSQVAAGVLAQDVTAPNGSPATASALLRLGKVLPSGLDWPDGASDQQKATAIADLARLTIFIQVEA